MKFTTIYNRTTALIAATFVPSIGATTVAYAGCSDPAAPKVNWENCDKSKVDLTRPNLAGANLSGINLSGATLFNPNLAGANLSGANLSGMSMIDANLTGANLSNANLAGANLWGSNLRNALLTGVDLKSTKDLTGVNLSGAILVKCAEGSIGACK